MALYLDQINSDLSMAEKSLEELVKSGKFYDPDDSKRHQDAIQGRLKAADVIGQYQSGEVNPGISNPGRPLLERIMQLRQAQAQETKSPSQQVTGNLSIDQSLSSARPFAEANFAPGSLGRLSEERSAESQDLLERRKASLQGLSAQENQAARDQLFQSVNQDTQSNLRSLRGLQGASGQTGSSAVTQQIGVMGAGQKTRADLERDLLLKNVEMKRQNLGDYETSLGNVQAKEGDAKLFNLGQVAQEKAGLLSTQFGLAELAQAERASLRGLQAAANAAGGVNAPSLLSTLRLR